MRLAASVLTAVAYAGALVSVGGWWFTMLVIRGAPSVRWAMVIDRAAILAVVGAHRGDPDAHRPSRRRDERAPRR